MTAHEESSTWGSRGWSFSDVLVQVSGLALLGLLALRVIRYLPLTLPESLDSALGSALTAAWLLFVFPLLLAPKHLLALLVLALVLALRPGLFLSRRQRVWRLRPWFHAFLWLECALNHYLFDINPYLALLGVLGLLVVELDARLPAQVTWRRWQLGLIVPLFLLWLSASKTWADKAAGFLLALLVFLTLTVIKPRTGVRERRLLTVLGVAASQILASLLPLAYPTHGGTKLGSGMAYTFCESPDAKKLFAAVPNELSMVPWSVGRRHGRWGFVAEHDLPGLTSARRHRFFSPEFYGRLEWVHCLEKTVQVGMTNTYYHGRQDQDHAMEFSMEDPRDFQPDLLGGGAGHGIAYDPRRDALYYVSENKPVILRRDRGGGVSEPVMEEIPQKKPFLSLVVGKRTTHNDRDSIFFTEWFNGSHAYEVSLATSNLIQMFPHQNGGALGITVDEDMNRVYVVGLWGMEVFDISTGELLARRRLGLLSRSPAIDTANDLVYVTSTSEGKIRVFDRHSLDLLGVLAVGHGPRIPYYSASASKLFSNSSLAYYSWDADQLALRFRGDG